MSENFNTDTLSNLDAKDLQKLQQIINKMIDKKNNTPKRSRKKTHKNKPQKPEPEPEQQLLQKRKVRRPKQHTQEQVQKKPCRVEPLEVNKQRKNLFIEHGWDKLENSKRERELSKLLSGDNDITPRLGSRLIEVACRRCGNIYKVSPSIVYRDEEGIVYTCDKCIG